MAATDCTFCPFPISAANAKDMVYGAITLTCGCKAHRMCACKAFGDGLVCLCDKVQEAVHRDAKRGHSIDMGNANIVQAKQMADILSQPEKRSVAKPPVVAGRGALPPKQPMLPPPTRDPAVVRSNMSAVLRSGLPVDKMWQNGVPLNEAKKAGLTIDKNLVNFQKPLSEFENLLDPHDPWGDAVAMGLQWHHLKNKALLPPSEVARVLKPSGKQFLSLFIDKDMMVTAYQPNRHTDPMKRIEENDVKEQLRHIPLERLMEINYQPKEYSEVGVTLAHIMQVLHATKEEAEKVYKRNEAQARLVWDYSAVQKLDDLQ